MEHKINIKTKSGNVINNIDRCLDKLALIGRRYETRQDFDRKPRVTYAFDIKESIVSIGSRFVEDPGRGVGCRVDCDVLDDGDSHVGMSLETEGKDRYADEEHGHHSHDLERKKYKKCISLKGFCNNSQFNVDVFKDCFLL